MFSLSFLSLGPFFKKSKVEPHCPPTPSQLHQKPLGQEGGHASVILTSSSGNSHVQPELRNFEVEAGGRILPGGPSRPPQKGRRQF